MLFEVWCIRCFANVYAVSAFCIRSMPATEWHLSRGAMQARWKSRRNDHKSSRRDFISGRGAMNEWMKFVHLAHELRFTPSFLSRIAMRTRNRLDMWNTPKRRTISPPSLRVLRWRIASASTSSEWTRSTVPGCKFQVRLRLIPHRTPNTQGAAIVKSGHEMPPCRRKVSET